MAENKTNWKCSVQMNESFVQKAGDSEKNNPLKDLFQGQICHCFVEKKDDT